MKKKAKTAPKSGGFAGHNPHRVMEGGMPRTLGMRIVTVTRKKVIGEMPVDDRHMNRSARVNGGALMAFADALGAAGTVANLPASCRTTTLESKTNFFAGGVGPVMKGVSIPLHVGRTTNVWQTTISNADGRIVAIVTQTQIVIPASVDPAIGATTQDRPSRRKAK